MKPFVPHPKRIEMKKLKLIDWKTTKANRETSTIILLRWKDRYDGHEHAPLVANLSLGANLWQKLRYKFLKSRFRKSTKWQKERVCNKKFKIVGNNMMIRALAFLSISKTSFRGTYQQPQQSIVQEKKKPFTNSAQEARCINKLSQYVITVQWCARKTWY